MRVLGIETSCDDTGVAVVDDGCRVVVNLVASQLEHAEFGGVVPEIAARKHVEVLPGLLERALADAETDLDGIDALAVTRGPGLIGALLAGWCFGRGLARSRGLPWVGVHHLAAHVHGALMPALEAGQKIRYPLIAMVVSGGHTALYHLAAEGRFQLLGKTRDDAAGEAFDKVSTLLGLGYPGGPVIDRLASGGDAAAVDLPRPDLGLDFSFSGLKTAVRRAALAQGLRPGEPEDSRVLDLVAAFQAAAVDTLAATTERALQARPVRGLVLSGGVAANSALRARFQDLADEQGIAFYRSPPALSTDNAAMIAGLGHARLVRGESDALDQPALASWPIPERVS